VISNGCKTYIGYIVLHELRTEITCKSFETAEIFWGIELVQSVGPFFRNAVISNGTKAAQSKIAI